MKAIKGLGIAILVLLVIALVVSVFLPSDIHIERSKVVRASPDVVFMEINNLRRWRNWSPWNKTDVNKKITYEGPEQGKGAKYSWKSENSEIGKGSLWITESVPSKNVSLQMDFIDRGTGRANFALEPANETGTKVIWSMDFKMGNNPIAKFIGQMMKNKLGTTFEEGLKNLNVVALKEQSNIINQQTTQIKPDSTAVASGM